MKEHGHERCYLERQEMSQLMKRKTQIMNKLNSMGNFIELKVGGLIKYYRELQKKY